MSFPVLLHMRLVICRAASWWICCVAEDGKATGRVAREKDGMNFRDSLLPRFFRGRFTVVATYVRCCLSMMRILSEIEFHNEQLS